MARAWFPEAEAPWSFPSALAAAASSTVEIYQRLQVETGWPEEAMGKRYAQVTEYRLPLEEDLDNETYVDIVNRQGQPYIRNVGILRWVRKHTACLVCREERMLYNSLSSNDRFGLTRDVREPVCAEVRLPAACVQVPRSRALRLWHVVGGHRDGQPPGAGRQRRLPRRPQVRGG